MALYLSLCSLFGQADTCLQSAGSQGGLQTSPKDDTIHSSEQLAAEHHGSQLGVWQPQQLQLTLRERLPAAQGWAQQRRGESHRAVQHHQRLHCSHHTWRSIVRKHIAPPTRTGGFVPKQTRTDVPSMSLTTYCADWILRKSSVVTVDLQQWSHCWWWKTRWCVKEYTLWTKWYRLSGCHEGWCVMAEWSPCFEELLFGWSQCSQYVRLFRFVLFADINCEEMCSNDKCLNTDGLKYVHFWILNNHIDLLAWNQSKV